jgi:glycosyltransferase involved in cell wall biosynthesis
LLQRALASVEAQGFRDLEVLVVDDASTDGSVSWLRGHHPDIRVLRTETPIGAGGARNWGIEHARGELIAFLDDDDVWRSEYLEAQVENLDVNPTAVLSYADHVEIDASGRVSRPDTRALLMYASPLIRLLAETFIHTLSVVVCRRSGFDRFGGFDEKQTIVHDLDWYARILAGGGSFAHLPRPLVGRTVPGGLVLSHRRWFREERAILHRAFVRDPAPRRHARMIHAYRSLLFARIALAKGDVGFGVLRLAEAFVSSPHWTMAIATRRLIRRLRVEGTPEGWDPTVLSAG